MENYAAIIPLYTLKKPQMKTCQNEKEEIVSENQLTVHVIDLDSSGQLY